VDNFYLTSQFCGVVSDLINHYF